jgi:dihydroflavonol-4-reductase
VTGRSLVTGATGFLGSQLCRTLLDRDTSVTGLRRASSDSDHLPTDSLEWETADVRDEQAVAEAVDGHDRVFHLAGLGLGSADAATVERVNREGTRSVVAACERAGVDRLLFVSTAGTRRSDGRADESDIADPVGAYQCSKRDAERLVDRAARNGLDTVTVHPTSAFGPGDDTFTARLLTLATRPSPVYLPGGTSFVGVDDVVDGIVAAMERGTGGEHYILGGENLTYGEALSVIERTTRGSRPPVRVPELAVHAAGVAVGVVNDTFDTRLFPFDAEMAHLVTDHHFYSSEKARSELGYTTSPFPTVVPRAMDWFQRELT